MLDKIERIGADRMAREIARLVELGRIGARSAASDAMLDYLRVGAPDGPQSVPEWVARYDAEREKGGA